MKRLIAVFSLLLTASLLLTGGAPRIGNLDVTAAGTAEQLSSTRIECFALTIQAKEDNTNDVCIGDSTVLCASEPGVMLEARESWTPPSPDRRQHFDLSKIYVDAETNGEGVSYLCWQ